MSRIKVFLSAVLAGMCVSFGGLVFLMLDNKIVGAALFTIGLFVICTFGFHLFTGKVCYVFQNDVQYAINLPIIWVGNLIGTELVAGIAALTRNVSTLVEKASALCQTKLNDSLVSLFFLGVLCNIFIYIAVDGFGKNEHELGKYLSLFFGVMVFILAGTEHCVADMFYFWMGGAWSADAIIRILVITLGNAVGGCGFCVLHGLVKSK
ncbi:MAG: formate/nitrite transporter family protein [Oscillospiraceae bacterium]|nr:formate/nitrite transporter family protein [Oscillospiraceae bacterium]